MDPLLDMLKEILLERRLGHRIAPHQLEGATISIEARRFETHAKGRWGGAVTE
jgi:hypothetical protein